MANAVYPKYKAAAISGGANANLLTGVVKILLVDLASYTYAATHEFLSDVPAPARVATSNALADKAVSILAAFKSSNGRFEGISGLESEALIGFVDTGVAATSRLVWFQDTGVTGLPVTPEGGSYNIIMHADGWFIL